jgi:hypothetical protein
MKINKYIYIHIYIRFCSRLVLHLTVALRTVHYHCQNHSSTPTGTEVSVAIFPQRSNEFWTAERNTIPTSLLVLAQVARWRCWSLQRGAVDGKEEKAAGDTRSLLCVETERCAVRKVWIRVPQRPALPQMLRSSTSADLVRRAHAWKLQSAGRV